MKKDKLIIVGSAVLLILLAFFGGLSYGKNSAGSKISKGGQFFAGNLNEQTPNGGMMRGGQTGGFTGGEVVSVDDKGFTVKLRDGSSKIVFLSGATEILKFATGTVSDIRVGEQVTVSGSANGDGSITAGSIQLRPQVMKVN